MSGYRGRAGPNFSEFLNSLNTISPTYDQDQFNTEDMNLDEDLAMFTNTDFTHFDIPSLPDSGALSYDLENENKLDDSIKYEDLLAGPTPSSGLDASPIDYRPSEPVPFYPNYNTPIQPAPPANGFAAPIPPPSSIASSPTSSQAQPSKKRKAEAAASPAVSAEEQARLAAEEDKRRRNTAASARFRVKKKQREQNLEKTVKEANERNAALDAKVSQLEMENKWLKNLITEKNGNQSKEDIAEAFQQFRRESEERDTKAGEHKRGVGTTS